jgi:hypothetical protein
MLTFTTDMLALSTLKFSHLKLRHGWSQRSGMLIVTCLTISLCWEQAGSGGSGIAGWSDMGFGGSKLEQVDLDLLVGVILPSL